MQKAISKYWPVFVLPTLIAFIIGFIWPFIWGIFLSFQRFTTAHKISENERFNLCYIPLVKWQND